jgi:CDP-glycerol glycerophosphotransferase
VGPLQGTIRGVAPLTLTDPRWDAPLRLAYSRNAPDGMGIAMQVVYHSFEGRYSDSPRAIYEAWRVRRPADQHVWLAQSDHRRDFPPDVQTVPVYGAECVRALESADLVIANTHTDVEWHKRPDTYYLQTWHGTPLKRIHFDVLWAPEGRLERLTRDVDKWDLLLSPNAESTPRLRRAFGFAGEVLECGYPRNELLLAPDRDAIRRRVRAELGIAEDVTVVLYTPTWRDDAVFSDGVAPIELALDVSKLAERLGPGYCVLLRVHVLQTERHRTIEHALVRDVSNHPEVAELYLAADAMVTDYSSTMFDFAVTGKPMVFFTYDLARYRDSIRGFYFDPTHEPPGPLFDDELQLADALADLAQVHRRYAPNYARFRERYCHLDDGCATERVLRRIWKQ